ncbi:hypothetical protein D9758_018011 [Tetrapyrgos nigripes]|uniref:Uncharacterized protein n=1 Tax=Tetrapyrgos nigripes TaxID=182062 RepID=A0A8H5C8Y8_9AGAR|nr:hypothetical protein D9758_018011 [Tetrapyrgos nigripes]
MSPYPLLILMLVALIAINSGTVIWHSLVLLLGQPPVYEISYSYTGSSVPLIHPMINELPLTTLTLQESTHFRWNENSSVSHDEFRTLIKYPDLSILGPNHRMTILSWYHNLHCIAQIRAALLDHNDPVSTPGHFSHCLQYLRQLLLCGASDMLEEGDFMEKNFNFDRVGSDLVCYDFEIALETLRTEMDTFEEWKSNGWHD